MKEVIKRDGTRQQVSFDKILDRIKQQVKGNPKKPELELEPLNENIVDVIEVSKPVIDGVYDGCTSKELDYLAAQTAAEFITDHPEYDKLAVRLLISALHKDTDDKKDIADVAYSLLNNWDSAKGVAAPLIRREYYDFCHLNRGMINNLLEAHWKNDYKFTYFGFKTLENSYLKQVNGKIVERPQHMYVRVAWEVTQGDLERFERVFKNLSNHLYTHATPTLFNSGAVRNQLSSCFLVAMQDDSIEGIYDTLKKTAVISKNSGGLGLHIHNIRAEGAPITDCPKGSTGIVPMLRPFNDTMNYVDQGRKRKGSMAIYLEPWHSDILDFLELRLPDGKEHQGRRTPDLFTALWIPDLFMQAVKDNADWYLFSPDSAPGLSDCYGQEWLDLYWQYVEEKRYTKKIKAMDVWDKIIQSQQESGLPYMLYKDAANKKSNQKNLGTIKSSNLCVAPETLLLTDKGHIPIGLLEDEEVNVWNGNAFSKTTVRKTGENQKLIKVITDSGQELECTPYHKFYVKNDYKLPAVMVEAQELRPGDKLERLETKPISIGETPGQDLLLAYTQGVYSGDGCLVKRTYGEHHPRIYLYGQKRELLPYLGAYKNYYVQESQDRIVIDFAPDSALEPDKGYVPGNNSLLDERLNWFAGLLDSEGTLVENNGSQSLHLASINVEFLKEVQLMLQTLGVQSKIKLRQEEGYRLMPANDGTGQFKEFFCNTSYRLLISANGCHKLYRLGLPTKRIILNGKEPNRKAERSVKVLEVLDLGRTDTTYCLNEPLEHKAVFNGILTGNCTEILEYSSPEETAVCNLASISLKSCFAPQEKDQFNFGKLGVITRELVRNLNTVIDNSYYPTECTKRSNLRHRPIGIGVQGLADLFALMGYAFDSEEAKWYNRAIFEEIYFSALKESNLLAQQYGAYETFEGSPASLGYLQFDLWGLSHNDLSGRISAQEWDALKEDIMVHGLRNSLLIAPMPTASCVTSNTRILTSDGAKSYQEIMEEQGIDWKLQETSTEQTIIPFTAPIQVHTSNGLEEAPHIIYNGHQECFDLELEDGTTVTCTENHKFLVNTNDGAKWVQTKDLKPNDDIICVKP